MIPQRSLLGKWQLIKNILSDGGLGSSAKLTAAQLLFHHNTKTGRCFPSESTLARTMGISVRQIRRAIKQLTDRGWVVVQRRRNKSNQYNFNWKRQPDARDDDRDIDVQFDGDIGVTGRGHPCPAMGTPLSDGGDTSVLLTHEHNKGSEQEKLTLSRKEVFFDEDHALTGGDEDILFVPSQEELVLHSPDDPFERFWQIYPRRVGKAEAHRAFADAVKSGVDPEIIIRGAGRYANWRAAKKQPEYDKYPSTWLKGEHWDDEIASTTIHHDSLVADNDPTALYFHNQLKAKGVLK